MITFGIFLRFPADGGAVIRVVEEGMSHIFTAGRIWWCPQVRALVMSTRPRSLPIATALLLRISGGMLPIVVVVVLVVVSTSSSAIGVVLLVSTTTTISTTTTFRLGGSVPREETFYLQ
eukprot:g13922.t1